MILDANLQNKVGDKATYMVNKVVIGKLKAKQAGGNNAGPHHRYDHVPEGLKLRTAINFGAFVKFFGDALKK